MSRQVFLIILLVVVLLVALSVASVASGGSSTKCGVLNQSSSLTIQNSIVSSDEIGICNMANSGTWAAAVDNWQITSVTNTITSDNYYSTRGGGSKLEGGPVAGTVTCAGVYDKNYVFSASTCP